MEEITNCAYGNTDKREKVSYDSENELLAGLIKNGINAKGYTLTEYNADDTLRQAYTYVNGPYRC